MSQKIYKPITYRFIQSMERMHSMMKMREVPSLLLIKEIEILESIINKIKEQLIGESWRF